MGDHLRPLTNDERREALLAGLNEAPSALTGWPGVLEIAYELGPPKRRVLSLPPVHLTPRRVRLARAWAPYARLRTEAASRGMRSALETVGDQVAKIMDSLSRIVAPRVPVAPLTADDFTKGA